MIYIKEHNALFNSPEVKEPLLGTFIKRIEFNKRFAAYQQWLSSKAKIIGDHSFVEGIDYQENVHYRLEENIRFQKTGSNDFDGAFKEVKFLVAIPIKEDKKRI